MNKRISTLSAWLSLCALLGVTGLLAPPALAQVREIRIAVPDVGAGGKRSGGTVVDVLRSQHLLERAFAEDGIEINWSFHKGAGPSINEALASGQVDFTYLGDLAAIVGKANGLDTRLLSAAGRNLSLYLGTQPGAGIKTLADLKGKRVALFRGTALQLSFAQALASQGLRERDLKVINLDMAASGAALAARQIDATWGSLNLLALRDQGLADVPLSTDDLGGAGSAQMVLVAAGAFVDAHPQWVERFLQAHIAALQWLRDERNKAAYFELASAQSGLPVELLRADLGRKDLRETFDPRLDPGFLRHLQASVDLAAAERLIRKGFTVRDWVEPRHRQSPEVATSP